jgi:antitoxin component of MazEF toxin-antitoxin module
MLKGIHEVTDEVPIIVKRKLIETGDSISVTIPPEWLKKHNLTSKDYLIVVANTNLTMLPATEESIKSLKELLKENLGEFTE